MLNLRALLGRKPALFHFDAQWRATATVVVSSTAQSSTFRPSLLLQLAPPSQLDHRVVVVQVRLYSLVRGTATFFQRVNHRGGANPQHSCRVPDATAIHRHVADLLLHFLQSSPVTELQDKRSPGAS